MSTISTAIKEYRKKNHLTQAAFGKMIGVNKQTVSKWEKGILVPSSEKTLEITTAIGVTPQDLLEKEELFVFEERTEYNIGINALYHNTTDFDSFFWFADSYSAFRDTIENGKQLSNIVIFNNTWKNDLDDAPCIPCFVTATETDLVLQFELPSGLGYNSEGDSLESELERNIFIPKEEIIAVQKAGKFNNTVYCFDFHFDLDSVLSKELEISFIQIHFPIE